MENDLATHYPQALLCKPLLWPKNPPRNDYRDSYASSDVYEINLYIKPSYHILHLRNQTFIIGLAFTDSNRIV